MSFEIYTLNGKYLLDQIKANCNKNIAPVVNFSEDVILTLNEYEDSALFYQLRQEMGCKIKDNSRNMLSKLFFYVDFNLAFPLNSRECFDELFESGFCLDFGDGTLSHFVPFLSSQSQSKKLIYAFIRKDIFHNLRKRLDLDFDFEKDIEKKSISFLPKLYAYRALYMSSAKKAFLFSDELGAEFFSSENIIVLPEKIHNPSNAVTVFTATQKDGASVNGEAVLTQTEAEMEVSINCFDGEGIISPYARDIINSYLKTGKPLKEKTEEDKTEDQSFQVRMPFLKGVLHTVDFHQFLKDNKIDEEHAFVIDAFNRKRNLYKANVIITPSVFKLYGLIGHFDDYTDFMEHYFEMMQRYNHGLYVVKTESAFHNTQYVKLSSQQLSTFDLSSDDIDGIIKDHIKMADAFSPQNLEHPEKLEELFAVEDRAEWMNLLLAEPRFLSDPHIQATIKNHRVSRYNDIALGRILVRGENRFLSGDLFVFLIDLLERIADFSKEPLEECDELKKKRLYRGGVFMPQAVKENGRVALVRSPHLSRNEDVCTSIFSNHLYQKYLGHLKGVIMTGDNSYIPSALGGADFDGDHISIIYDERIIDACYKSGYVETKKSYKGAPFIKIKELNGRGRIEKYKYVSSQAVYNTFSNRIGNISNAAMKIAAVEYDSGIKKNDDTPKAAFCTILTGNEIDATKKGVRPHIDSVINFSQNLGSDAKEVVEEIEKYIKMKRFLECQRGKIPQVKKDGEFLTLPASQLPVTRFSKNSGKNAVAQLLYRWADAFLDFKPGVSTALSRKAYSELEGIFKDKPRAEKECNDIFLGFINALETYSCIHHNRVYLEERIKENNARIAVRLSGQYDDIYAYSDNELSLKDKIDNLQNAIYKLTANLDEEEISGLLNLLFSERQGVFNAKSFWPYSKGKDAKSNLLEKIMLLENADMLVNFEYEGYRLLNYLLQNALLVKQKITPSVIKSENAFEEKYIQMCYAKAKECLSISDFENKLAKIVLRDLAGAEGVNLEEADAINVLISRIYPLSDAKCIKAFWKVFTESQVISALRG